MWVVVMKVCQTDILVPQIDWNADKIIIRTNSEINLLELATDNTNFYELYTSLLKHDYMFYFHAMEKSYFIKRKLIYQIWKRRDLLRAGETFYTVEKPFSLRKEQSNRLVVVFSSMPLEDSTISPNIAERCFFHNYPSLVKHLLPNTFVVRIMDCNLTYGSYYLNTSNYPNFERDVQNLIRTVAYNLSVANKNIVLFGISKGGTGALYHSIIGDYHAVVVDPLFSLTKYIREGDSHFTQQEFPEKLTKLFTKHKSKIGPTRSKIIIGVPTVQENYLEYSNLVQDGLRVSDVVDQDITEHGQIGSRTMIEQVTYINGMLLNEI